MDFDALWKWLLAPSGLLAALAAWLFRRRKTALNGGGPVRWLGRRYDAEAGLVACEERERRKDRDFAEERIDWTRQQANWVQQRAALIQQTTDLMAMLDQLTQANQRILSLRDAGKLPVLSPAPAASPPSSPSGPTTPSGGT